MRENNEEKASGSKADRVIQLAIDVLRPDDAFIVYKHDRLARSTIKLISTLDEIKKRGSEFVSLNDSIDTSTAAGKSFFGNACGFCGV